MKVSLICFLLLNLTSKITSKPLFCLIKINGVVEVNATISETGKIINKKDIIILKEEKSEIVLFHVSGKEIILKGTQTIKVKKLVRQYNLKTIYCFSVYELSDLLQCKSYLFRTVIKRGAVTRPYPLALIIKDRRRNINFLNRDQAKYKIKWDWNKRYENFANQKIEDWNYVIAFEDLMGNVTIKDTIKGKNYFGVDFSNKKYDPIFEQDYRKYITYQLFCENKKIYSGSGYVFKIGIPTCINNIKTKRFGKLLFALYLENKDVITDIKSIYVELINDEKYGSFFLKYFTSFEKREKAKVNNLR